MESPFLEIQKRWFLRITPRPLGENEHALSMPLHLRRCPFKSLHRRRPIRPINEHRPTEGHEPSQERGHLQTLLGRHTAVPWEYRRQQQNIQSRLMVPHKDGRPGVQMLFAGQDLELDAYRQGHGIFEGPSCGPLRDAVVADETKDYGGDDTVDGADGEGSVGGEETGVEGGCLGTEIGHAEEGRGEAEVEGEEAKEERNDEVHCCD